MKTDRKKALLPIILCIVLIAALVFGLNWYRNTYITINDTVYAREITELDLSGSPSPELEKLSELSGLQQLNLRDTGISIEEYEAVRAALPDCEILWSVPFQGSFLPDDTEEITLTSLTDADVAVLAAYLPGLSRVQAEGCTDYDQLMLLRAAFPQADVSYSVSVNGRSWPMDTAEMVLTDADAEELSAALPYLPGLKAVTLEGQLPPAEALIALRQAYPGIRFYWQISLFGQTADVDTTELDLSGILMDSTRELEAAVAYLPSLERVYMHDCGIPNDDMEALNNRHENILFVWTVKIGYQYFSTDTTTFMPLQLRLPLGDWNSHNLRYLTELIVLDLGHQEITHIEFVATMSKLKYLIIGDTDVGDISPLTGLDQLIYLEIFDTPVTDYTPLLTLTAMEDMNLSYTYGDYKIIAQMTWVDYIRWVQNYVLQITDEQKEYLRAQMPDTLLELGAHTSATAGQWRKTQNYYDMRDLLGMFYMHG